MILPNFKDFPCTGSILGIDWGARRLGVAISDKSQEYVFARPQIDDNTTKIDKLIEIIANENIMGIVIGLPILSDGSDSNTTKMVREFAAALSEKTDLPIVFVDESLTSFEASEHLLGVKKVKQKLDSESARVILENAISMNKRIKI